MNKFKMILLLIALAVLADFFLENRSLPPQPLKLFTFSLGQASVYLLAYISLAVGLLLGWFGHLLRVRKKKRLATAALAQEKQAQQTQQGQQAGE